jgi:hypothetical protein
MHSIDTEVIELLRRSAKERGERIARKMEQVEELRRALWLRMDRLRDHHHHSASTSITFAPSIGGDGEATAAAPEEHRSVAAAAG